MFSSFNNCNILQLSHKDTSCEDIENNNQVVLDSISDNMAALVQTGKHGANKTSDTTTMVYYLIKYVSEATPYKGEKMCDRQISTPGELVVKAQYINCMPDNTKWY